MNKAIEALKLFRSLCDYQKVQDILVFGTAAMRIAKNADEFIKKVMKNANFLFKFYLVKKKQSTHFLGL